MNLSKKDSGLCTTNVLHNDALNRIKTNNINGETSTDLARFFKVLGDSTRIRILYALTKEELCVCDIKDLLNMTQSAISHQLRKLRDARLVKYRRDGKEVYYSLADDHVKNIFEQGMEHIEHK